jgi:phosphoribosylaminoimidazole-succinocarboxamide synthase
VTTKLNLQGREGNELAASLRKTELLVKSGKVKEVYVLNEKELEFHFTDQISVYDKRIPSLIPFKGEVLARTSAFWLKKAEEAGILTHFVDLTAPDAMRVKRVDVISDYSMLTTETVNYLIPLECITRYYVYGSLWERMAKGEITPEQLGFARGHEVTLGEALPKPFFEVTTKLEKVDRHLTEEEAIRISGITPQEFAQIKEACLKIDRIMDGAARAKGLIHVDGKKEFAFNGRRELMVVDTFGTADEDRWWDAGALTRGKYVERSKEIARQYYKDIGYYALLMKAREEGTEEPAIPPLPDRMIERISAEYVRLFEDMTGEKFR